MSSDVAIQVENICKIYRIYDRPHHRLMQSVTRRGEKKWYREFHALNDVGFNIYRGETVGIVGKNGSGKSTLLQIICGTLQPTSGRIDVNGRIAALLELGAGFNPDFTGRENVFLNGAVMGLTRSDIDRRFKSIVDFADIGDFIDQSVKTYSSGMYIRLAFAVAINADPQILVIDEALSVGDEAFQRKCFSRIEELKRGGCTILFVSHSAGSVVQLCDRAILLDGGEKLYMGSPKKTVAFYQRLLYAPIEKRPAIKKEILTYELSCEHSEHKDQDPEPADPATAVRQPVVMLEDLADMERFDPMLLPESTIEYESFGALIEAPAIINAGGQAVNVLLPGKEYVYRYRVKFSVAATRVHFGMMIKSISGIDLFGMASHSEGDAIDRVEAGSIIDVEFRFLSRFLPGTYFTNAGCFGSLDVGEPRFLHRILDVLMFKIETGETDRRKAGFYDLSNEPACTYAVTQPLA